MKLTLKRIRKFYFTLYSCR